MNTPNAPWLKYFGDIPAHLDYPSGSMYEAVRESAQRLKKMNSVAYEFQGKKTTYKQFLNKIELLGKAYRSIGINEGTTVTVTKGTRLKARLFWLSICFMKRCLRHLSRLTIL